MCSKDRTDNRATLKSTTKHGGADTLYLDIKVSCAPFYQHQRFYKAVPNNAYHAIITKLEC